MARLNEVTATTDSIESLKRKFIRQNRDIARANSTQSLRIRNLENEVSKLLAENLELRGQISHLQNELENGRAQNVVNQTNNLKVQLEGKLQELSLLVNALGSSSPKAKKELQKKGKAPSLSPARSPTQRQWRNICNSNEAVATQEGRLPPILENKSYPRRTLDHQEILELTSEAVVDDNITSDSPDIGPPPVSKFVDEDPVKIDRPNFARQERNEDTGLDPVLSINLEQRRKRKEIAGSVEARRRSRTEPVGDNRDHSGSMKAGAKCKLSVRDDDDLREEATKITQSPDEFKYTCVTQGTTGNVAVSSKPEKAKSITTREPAMGKISVQDDMSSAPIPASRKVLAPKSVNNSPRKASRVVSQIDTKPGIPEDKKSQLLKGRRERRHETIKIEAQAPNPVDTADIQPEPETPAALDLFSPLPSQPSTVRAESRDTPPPADLGSGMESQRPSRRARGAVSYAEPNLRDKMRRPTKDLVDAVNRDGKVQAGVVIKVEDDGQTGDPVPINIKTEPGMDDAWKTMLIASSSTAENSPLQSKFAGSEPLSSSISTHRKRRESLLHQVDAETQRSGSGSAIAALLAETRKAKAAAKAKERPGDNEDAITSAISKLDLSAEKDRISANLDDPQSTSERPPRHSRRYSSIPKDAILPDDGEVSEREFKKTDGPSRRRQSTLGVKTSTSGRMDSTSREAGERMMRRPLSTTITISGPSEGHNTDRASMRRKSMML